MLPAFSTQSVHKKLTFLWSRSLYSAVRKKLRRRKKLKRSRDVEVISWWPCQNCFLAGALGLDASCGQVLSSFCVSSSVYCLQCWQVIKEFLLWTQQRARPTEMSSWSSWRINTEETSRIWPPSVRIMHCKVMPCWLDALGTLPSMRNVRKIEARLLKSPYWKYICL